MEDSVFREMEANLTKIGKSRNWYINKAIRSYNQFQLRTVLAKKLKRESILVRDESMKVLVEFKD